MDRLTCCICGEEISEREDSENCGGCDKCEKVYRMWTEKYRARVDERNERIEQEKIMRSSVK